MDTKNDLLDHLPIGATLLFIVYGQLVIRWQMSRSGPLPAGWLDKLTFLLSHLLNPWILSGFAAAFLAALSWMAAMTRFELGYAYPFVSLALPLVVLSSSIILHEPLTPGRLLGSMLIAAGLVALQY